MIIVTALEVTVNVVAAAEFSPQEFTEYTLIVPVPVPTIRLIVLVVLGVAIDQPVPVTDQLYVAPATAAAV